MNIVVQVDGVTIDSVIGERYSDEVDHRVPVTLGQAVVEEVVRKLANTPEWGTLRERINQIRREVIRERVDAEVEAALTHPFAETNHYGEKTGKTMTLREEIAKVAAEAVVVDRRNAFSRQDTAAMKTIREEVDRALAAELKTVVADEKAKVVAAVRAKAADLIAQAVKEGVGR